MKNFVYTVGKRTRDLPACSAVPQPTAPLRAPCVMVVSNSFVKVNTRYCAELNITEVGSSYSSSFSFEAQKESSVGKLLMLLRTEQFHFTESHAV